MFPALSTLSSLLQGSLPLPPVPRNYAITMNTSVFIHHNLADTKASTHQYPTIRTPITLAEANQPTSSGLLGSKSRSPRISSTFDGLNGDQGPTVINWNISKTQVRSSERVTTSERWITQTLCHHPGVARMRDASLRMTIARFESRVVRSSSQRVPRQVGQAPWPYPPPLHISGCLALFSRLFQPTESHLPFELTAKSRRKGLRLASVLKVSQD